MSSMVRPDVLARPMKAERLRTTNDIRAVFSARGTAHAPSMSVHVRDRGDEGGPRVTVVATRKLGGAAARNRAKRRVRAALAHCDLSPGLDVVVVAREPALRAPFRDLVEQLGGLLSRAVSHANA